MIHNKMTKKKVVKKPLGKPKYIATPEIMLDHFNAYELKIKGAPFKIKDWVGKDAYEVQREREKPLTMEGFENYLFDQKIITDVSDYFENKDNRYSAYIPICRAIRRKIREDQISGGLAGVYNPSITQRLNNLVDKSETEVKQTIFKVGYKKKEDE